LKQDVLIQEAFAPTVFLSKHLAHAYSLTILISTMLFQI